MVTFCEQKKRFLHLVWSISLFHFSLIERCPSLSSSASYSSWHRSMMSKAGISLSISVALLSNRIISYRSPSLMRFVVVPISERWHWLKLIISGRKRGGRMFFEIEIEDRWSIIQLNLFIKISFGDWPSEDISPEYTRHWTNRWTVIFSFNASPLSLSLTPYYFIFRDSFQRVNHHVF